VNFCEITHPDYPGERLVCSPTLSYNRAGPHAEALLTSTEAELKEVVNTHASVLVARFETRT